MLHFVLAKSFLSHVSVIISIIIRYTAVEYVRIIIQELQVRFLCYININRLMVQCNNCTAQDKVSFISIVKTRTSNLTQLYISFILNQDWNLYCLSMLSLNLWYLLYYNLAHRSQTTSMDNWWHNFILEFWYFLKFMQN